jgi:bromodomain-containing protein 9
MHRHDKFSVFAEPVTETEAPGYHEIINQPMDFGTMRKKLKKGKYGTGSKAVALLYQDFLLVFDNCHRYNSDDSDVTKEASRMFGLLPEAFVAACNSVVKSTTK